MNEKKKSIILLCIVGIIILFILIGIVSNIIASGKELEKFKNYYNSEEPTLVVIRKDNCVYCQAYEPEIEFLSKNYGFSYETFSIDKLNSSSNKELLNMIGIVDASNFGTPYTVLVQNGKVLDKLEGAQEENVIFEFLKKNKLVKEEEKLLIDYLDYNGYVNALKGKDISIITLAQTSCIHCKNVKPILNELIRDYNLNIKVLNLDVLSNEEQEKLQDTLDFYTQVNWGTPTFLIVQKGKLIDYIQGEQDKETFVEKFKELGIIGE